MANVFKTKPKAYLTLLETLIAMSLLSLLLVFVFGFFRELSEITRMTEKGQKESFQMRYLESRLGFIFDRLVNENDSARKFIFYTSSSNQNHSAIPSLVLTFNNEVRLDPTFSGDILAKFYVDSDHRLCLAMWPLHVTDPYEYLYEEVLMDHVVDVHYSFYASPEQIKGGNDIITKKIDPEKKEPEKDKWHEEWLMSYDQMPSMMKMTVTIEIEPEFKKKSKSDSFNRETTKTLEFYFVLPSSNHPLYYPPGELVL